jgi:hypothetical protein
MVFRSLENLFARQYGKEVVAMSKKNRVLWLLLVVFAFVVMAGGCGGGGDGDEDNLVVTPTPEPTPTPTPDLSFSKINYIFSAGAFTVAGSAPANEPVDVVLPHKGMMLLTMATDNEEIAPVQKIFIAGDSAVNLGAIQTVDNVVQNGIVAEEDELFLPYPDEITSSQLKEVNRNVADLIDLANDITEADKIWLDEHATDGILTGDLKTGFERLNYVLNKFIFSIEKREEWYKLLMGKEFVSTREYNVIKADIEHLKLGLENAVDAVEIVAKNGNIAAGAELVGTVFGLKDAINSGQEMSRLAKPVEEVTMDCINKIGDVSPEELGFELGRCQMEYARIRKGVGNKMELQAKTKGMVFGITQDPGEEQGKLTQVKFEPKLPMLEPNPLELVVGGPSQKLTLKHYGEVIQATRWVSQHPNIATVDNQGNVTPVAKGNTQIGAYSPWPGFRDPVGVWCQVIVSPQLATVKVRVLNYDNGNPIGNATVTLGSEDGSKYLLPPVSNANGDYIGQIPVGAYTVTIVADGFEPEDSKQQITVKPKGGTRTFTLRPVQFQPPDPSMPTPPVPDPTPEAETVTVTVTVKGATSTFDTNPEPLAGATLTAHTINGDEVSYKTNTNGRASFQVPVDSLGFAGSLDFVASGYQSLLNLQLGIGQEGQTTINLGEIVLYSTSPLPTPSPNPGGGARYYGNVVKISDATPIQGAKVTISTTEGTLIGEMLTDAQGAFSIPVPSPGPYKTSITATGYISIIGPVGIPDNPVVGFYYPMFPESGPLY